MTFPNSSSTSALVFGPARAELVALCGELADEVGQGAVVGVSSGFTSQAATESSAAWCQSMKITRTIA